MMITKIHYTTGFIRDLKGLSREKQKQAIKKEKLFKLNPNDSSLKIHKLTGKLENYLSFSINYKDRIIFCFINQNEVLFIRIGNHDIYK